MFLTVSSHKLNQPQINVWFFFCRSGFYLPVQVFLCLPIMHILLTKYWMKKLWLRLPPAMWMQECCLLVKAGSTHAVFWVRSGSKHLSPSIMLPLHYGSILWLHKTVKLCVWFQPEGINRNIIQVSLVWLLIVTS